MASTKQHRKGKSMTNEQKQEKAAREKRLLSAEEKILGIKRQVLKIVEFMLEENLSTKWVLENCPKLCQQDYEDVVQERNIEHLCGYPLCNKPIVEILKQQYRICRATVKTYKVYDVTERKCFCCNECYKASNYLKAQLSEVPLYLRKPGMSITLHLISEKENSGSGGEEIKFQVTIDKDEIEKACTETPAINLSKILKEEVKGMEEHLSKLKITEHTYEKPFVFGSKIQDQPVQNNLDANESHSESSDTEDNQEKDDEPQNFPEYSNISLLTNKYMPTRETNKKVIIIEAIQAKTVCESTTISTSIDFISNVFYDWFTEVTMKYLIGERKFYAMKADNLFQTMINSNSDELSSVKNEYIDLCFKMDKLQEEEEYSDSVEFEVDAMSSVPDTKSVCSMPKESDSTAEQTLIPKRRPKRKSGKKKVVSFAADVKDVSKEQIVEPVEESEPSPSISEPTFPLVDSIHQNAIRRQILTGSLRAVYFKVLPLVGHRYIDMRDAMKKIVRTFSLTPTNITFQPKEWECIALVLLRILAQNALYVLDNTDYLKLCETLLKNSTISVQEINDLAIDLVSSNQLRRLQSYNK